VNARTPRPAITILVIVALVAVAVPAAAQSGVAQRIQYGEVVSAQPTIVVEQSRGGGAQVGSTVGAVAGYALADRGDRWLGSLLGGVVGAAAGNAVEKKSKRKKGWELIIRLGNGEEIGLQVPGRREQYRPGDRVRLMTAGGRTTVSRV
jgi:outer membrane lipoprotein SlyB